MGRGHMTDVLSKYLDKNYPNSKADLFATFMDMMIDKTAERGRTAFITMESWMFLSSFEKFRKEIVENYYISSLGHFGWHIIGIAFGTAMTVIEKAKPYGRKGEYSYLTIDDVDRSINIPYVFPKKDNGRYSIVNQQDFEKIPGCPIGYSISSKIANSFQHNKMDFYSKPSKGMMPGSDYLRLFWEVSCQQIETRVMNHTQSLTSPLKWYPYFKGGSFRRWYGNKIFVVDYQFDGVHVKSGDRNPALYFKDNINWSKIASGLYSARKGEQGSLYDDAACQCYVFDNDNYQYLLGLLNSKYAQSILWCKSQTFNYVPSEIAQIPVVIDKNKKNSLDYLVQQNITISKEDWDAHETSWDFKENELVRIFNDNGWGTLDIVVSEYKREWERLFMQLHANEEELNRQFIEIYGLQDELTPDVPLDEITILQQGEILIENNDIVWHNDVIAKQLISYAIGCWMGRYRLDKPGLHIAHPNPTAEEVCTYTYNGCELDIDDDGIIPILSADSSFADNACHRMRDFLRIAFGEENLLENINFIETCLGKSIEAYFMKDFWKDHKKMYQNRPIYWLFSSKKGAFQCLAYMHRMDAYTVERVRSKYLLPHMDWLTHRINELRADDAMLTTAQRKTAERLEKELAECREYHERLHYVADQQFSFDLDDGVVVNYAKFGDILAKIK